MVARATFRACAVVGALLGGGSGAPVLAAPEPRVLVVHAYHPGFEWTDRLHGGFVAALRGSEATVHVEHLDLKRLAGTAHLDALAEALASKYRGYPFDAVVAFDDHAVDFVLEHRARLAPEAPVVFGGLNDYRREALAGVPELTGVVETVDLVGTLRLARALAPDARRVVVVSDRTRTSSALADRLRALARSTPSRLRFEFVTAESLEAAAERLGRAEGAVGLLLPFNRGPGGTFVDYRRAARYLAERSSVPLFSCWDFYLGHGVVGGQLTSADLIGREVGARVRRILSGERPEDIPILEESPTVLRVDHRALRENGLPLARVPAEADVVGRPARTVPIDRNVILSVLGAAGALAFAVILLSSNVLRRRRAEARLRAHQEAVERALDHESLLAEVAARLNATDDFKVVLDELLARLTGRLDVAKISLYSFSDDQPVAAKISSRLSERGSNIRDLDVLSFRPILKVYEALQRNERVISGDLENLAPAEQSFYRGRNIRAVVILPVQVAGRVKGVLGFAQNEAHAWSDEEVTVFETVSRIIAAAWERYEQMAARIEAEAKHADAARALERTSRVAALGVMAAGITHEINQPLNAIRVTADGALRRARRADEAWPEAAVKKLRTISSAALRIDAIIRHMREFWAPPTERGLEVVDARDAITRAFELVGRQARNHGVEVQFRQSAEPLPVRASPVQLEQVVINLVVNAVQALGEEGAGGHIWITTSVGEACVLSVEDDGPGVPEADVPNLFEPFFSTKAAPKGTGLGLAIVKNIVTSFEGTVAYYDRPAGGAEFRVTLPRWEPGRIAS